MVLPELEKNPELRAMRANDQLDFKFINPLDHPGLVIGEGQGQKAITLYTRDQASLEKALKIVDDALAKHGDALPPVHPAGADNSLGKSGRVTVTRDTYTRACDKDFNIGARLDDELTSRIQADRNIGFRADGTLDPEFRNPETGKLTTAGRTGETARHQQVESKEHTSPLLEKSEALPESLMDSRRELTSKVREPLAAALQMLGKSASQIESQLATPEQMHALLNDQKIQKLLGTESMRRAFPQTPDLDEQLKLIDRYVAARTQLDDVKS